VTERTTDATCGPCSPTAFAWYDPDTHSWRTSQGTFLSDSVTFSQTWPRSGMTHAGIAYQQQPSAPLTVVTEYSSSLHERTWPTPTAHLAKEGAYPAEGRRNEPSLTFQALDGQVGHLNPMWVEWLMGFPTGWTDLEPSETL